MDAKKVGVTIRFLRKRLGWTQQDLAQKLLVSDKAVSKWERGVGVPDISLLQKISILLDVDIDSLLEGAVTQKENTWVGLLYLDEKAFLQIHDKPLVTYLLSNFLLAKITEIFVFCVESQKKHLLNLYGTGEEYGVCLHYCAIPSFEPASSNLLLHLDKLSQKNIMLVYGNSLIYGVNLSRFFQRALLNRKPYTLLAITKNCQDKKLLIDDQKRITHDPKDAIDTKWNYCRLPIFFCRAGIKDLTKYAFDSFELLIRNLSFENRIYVELMDRGFVSIDVSGEAAAIADASELVAIIQRNTGQAVCSLEEIAHNRGLLEHDLSYKYK